MEVKVLKFLEIMVQTKVFIKQNNPHIKKLNKFLFVQKNLSFQKGDAKLCLQISNALTAFLISSLKLSTLQKKG